MFLSSIDRCIYMDDIIVGPNLATMDNDIRDCPNPNFNVHAHQNEANL